MRHALIMAAGRGRRMMPLTDDRPKAMAPYRGTTLIAHGIDKIRRHIDHIHVTVGYRGAMLAEHVIKHGVRTVFNTEGHGNSWWIYNTFMRHVDEPVCVLTCDNVVDLDFNVLQEEYDALDKPACMVVPVEPIPGLEGDYIHHDDQVVTRLDRHDPAPTYCSGIQVINPSAMRELTVEADNFTDLWTQLIPQRQVLASRIYPKQWFTVDTERHLDELLDLDREASSSG